MPKGKINTCRSCGTACDYRNDICQTCTAQERKIDPKQRLADMTERRGDCLVFTGYCLSSGYGRIGGGRGKTVLAHRLSWEVNFGSIPDGMLVCHRCDNPPCVNPEHLFLGTHYDNIIDMISKGRDRHPETIPKKQGELHPLAKFKAEQIREIRRRSCEPRKKLAEEFGMAPQYVSAIINGRKWAYLD